uniref:Uncharacterized protein n=1 Tax=Anguilla anguilla TaxID=7936 RepID=A0A0E9U3B5_ANGAN
MCEVLKFIFWVPILETF